MNEGALWKWKIGVPKGQNTSIGKHMELKT
jgi:hypothetical protein